MRKTRPKNQHSSVSDLTTDLPTFGDHLQELRNRLFWVAVAFVLASAVAFPFYETILAALVRPLGDLPLHYLTPAGGFSFIIKVCMFTGMVATIPVAIYQFFQYIQPAMGRVRRITIAAYVVASVFLAFLGVILAFMFSLPAALGFLTGFELPQITAMITADAYFSFTMTYLIAAAVLFQLPLILMIINNITPLSPGGMMKKQRYVILVAFILGAIISPTPDILNQLLMAGPIIVMYQIGIILVMIQNAMKREKAPLRVAPAIEAVPLRSAAAQAQTASTSPATQLKNTPYALPQAALGASHAAAGAFPPSRQLSVDGLVQRRTVARSAPPPRSNVTPVVRSVQRIERPEVASSPSSYRRSIDGFIISY